MKVKRILIVILFIILVQTGIATAEHRADMWQEFEEEARQNGEAVCEVNFNKYLQRNNLINDYNKIVFIKCK